VPRIYSMAYLTSAPLAPPDAIRLAARCGYQAVGIRIQPASLGGDFSPLIEDRSLLAATRAAMAETGVGIFDVEIVRLAADFEATTLKPFLDVCATLGARAVLVAGDDPDEARLTASFAAFCQAAAPYGLTADLEFMPWTKVPDAKTALRIVTLAGEPNGGILVDALHAARSTTTHADLTDLPRHMMHYAQICDAPAEVPTTVEGLIHTARQERLIPGEGGIDLSALFDCLPLDIPVSIEIPNVTGKARLGVEGWAARALAATKTVLRA
jgi:sugar phosphate isomerase/epimerase